MPEIFELELGRAGRVIIDDLCYGFDPGAQLTGLCTEDERVWGATEWGIGFQGPYFKGAQGDAVSICLNSMVWLDQELLLRESCFVQRELWENNDVGKINLF